MLSSPILTFASRTPAFVGPHVEPETLTASYTALSPDMPAARVELHAGAVSVDGRRVARPKFSRTAISWSEKTPSGYSAGLLRVAAHGALLSGFLAHGPDETAMPRSILLAATGLDFTTQVCQHPDQTPQQWEAGPPFGIQIAFQDGLPTASATIGDDPATIAVLTPTGTSIPVQIGVEEWVHEAEPYPVPCSSSIAIAFDGSGFTGTMIPWTDGGAATASIGWRGTAVASPALAATAAFENLAATVDTDPSLSIADLVSIDTDGAGDIAKQKFENFVVYAMDDDWRNKLTSAPKPALTAAEIAVLNSNLDYYTGHVCDPFLLQLLSKVGTDAGGPKTPISDSDKLKLRYFWQSRLATKPGYTDQSNRITQLAYEDVAPRIALYVNDGTTNWAQTLYQAMTTQNALSSAVLSFIGDGWKTTTIDRHTELLLALSPTANQTIGGPGNAQPCTYATLYHAAAMAALAQKLAAQAGPVTPESVDDLKAWIPDWITQLKATIANGLTDPNLEPGKKALFIEIQADLAAAEAQAGNATALANQISTSLLASEGTTMLGKLSNWLKTSKLGMGLNKAIAGAAFCFALFQVISAFKGWNALTPEQRAQTITSAVELGVNLIADIGDVAVSKIIPALMSPSAGEQVAAAISDELFTGLDIGDNFFLDTTERMAEELAAPVVGATESAFCKILAGGTVFMKGFAVLAAAAAVAYSTYRLYEDFSGSSSTVDKVLDSLGLAANVLVLASVVAAATVGECALAALGPLGLVAGIVLMLVSMFLPRDPPTRPADDYMNKVGTAALAGLEAPPADWVAAHPDPATPTGAPA